MGCGEGKQWKNDGMITFLTFVALGLGSYLIGSISFAWLITKAHGKELRDIGSGNLGATNVGRALGWHWFFVVFALDLGKGLVCVLGGGWLAEWLLAYNYGAEVADPFGTGLRVTAAVSAVLGHVFTIFHGFKGGKAVATSLGVVFGLIPLVAAATLAVFTVSWALVGSFLRIHRSNAVGPSAVIAAVFCVMLYLVLTPDAYMGSPWPITWLLLILCIVIVIRHRSNWGRVWKEHQDASAGHLTADAAPEPSNDDQPSPPAT